MDVCIKNLKYLEMLKILKRMCSTGIQNKPPISVFGIDGRYASALYSAGVVNKDLEKIEENLKAIQGILSKPAISDFLSTSLISRAEKAKLLQEIGSTAQFATSTTNFLALVAENGRLKLLKHMIAKFLMVMVAHRNQAMCEVITAKPLDDGTKESLKAALSKLAKGKSITLTETVDPSIIGGMIVGVEDKFIDMSISRKLTMYTDLIKIPI